MLTGAEGIVLGEVCGDAELRSWSICDTPALVKPSGTWLPGEASAGSGVTALMVWRKALRRLLVEALWVVLTDEEGSSVSGGSGLPI